MVENTKLIEPTSDIIKDQRSPLLTFAGMFAGGDGNTAKRAEEILEADVNAIDGFGNSASIIEKMDGAA